MEPLLRKAPEAEKKNDGTALFPSGIRNKQDGRGAAMLRAVLIGVSGFGAVHYRDLLRYHRAGVLRFTAATVIDKAVQREKCMEMQSLGIRIYDDYRTMLAEEEADLCCIPTGIAMHAPMSIAAMRAGMNVLVEKPAAARMADVEAIRETEKAAGCFTAVAFQDLYRPEILYLKRLILSGVIGRITHASVSATSTSGASYYQRNNWAGKLYCSGAPVFDSPFMNGNAHQLNLAFFLCGTAFDSSADIHAVSGELYRAQKIESFDTGAIRVRTGNGIDLFVVLSKSAEHPLPYRILLCGTRGEISISEKEIRLPGEKTIFMEQDPIRIRDNIFRNLFLRMHSPGEGFLVGMDLAESHVRCINLMHETLPIHPVNPAFLGVRGKPEGGSITFIRGINEILMQCLENHQMPGTVAPDRFHIPQGADAEELNAQAGNSMFERKSALRRGHVNPAAPECPAAV